MKIDVDPIDEPEIALAELSPLEEAIQHLGALESAIRRLKSDPERAHGLRDRTAKLVGEMRRLDLDAAIVPLERLQVALQDIADGVIPPMAMVLDDLRATVAHAARLVGTAWASAAQLATVMVIEHEPRLSNVVQRAVGFGRVLTAKNLQGAVEALAEQRVQAVLIGQLDVEVAEIFSWVPVIRARACRSSVAMIDDELSLEARVQAIHAGVTRLLPPPDETNVFVAAVRELCVEAPVNAGTALVYTEHEGFARELVSVLHVAGISAAHRASAVDLFHELDKLRPEAVVLGPHLNGVAGLDVLRVIRSSGRWRDLPIIYLAATQQPEERVRAYNAGADACFHHPISVDEMTARLRNVLHRARQRASLASLDPLTGLVARHTFIDQVIQRAGGHAVTVALIELDDARRLTSQHGFALVDEATVRLAQMLRASLEHTDVVGRWSSRRLVCALFGQNVEQTAMTLAKLNDDLGQEVLRADGVRVKLSISVGVAEATDRSRVEAALRIADTRLRVASGGGGGRVETA